VIGTGFIYGVAGLMFAAFAILSATDRTNPKRFGNGAFYAVLAISFLLGGKLGDIGNGVLVLALVAIAGSGAMGRGGRATTTLDERRTEAARLGNRIFLPALIIPAAALGGTVLFRAVPSLVDPKQATLVALTCGVLIALVAMHLWFGWAAVLPQMLASLGAVFALAGVGDVVGGLAGHAIPEGSLIGAVLAYTLGMALFTMVMGNAFAAFPVMAAAIGIPLLVRHYGGDPAVVAAIGMLSGFCGTLMTPMAANFNLVPAALLDLNDKNAVIRAQIPTALPLLAVNIGLLYWLGFR
jgi:uncharacterized membrane protein